MTERAVMIQLNLARADLVLVQQRLDALLRGESEEVLLARLAHASPRDPARMAMNGA